MRPGPADRGLVYGAVTALTPPQMVPVAYFHRQGDRLIPTELARGPWSSGHQHGGPPAALLAGALERAGADAAEYFVAKVALDLYRPVPLSPLRIETRLVRPGKRAQRWSAALFHDQELLAEAEGLRIVRAEVSLPPRDAIDPIEPAPDACPAFELDFFKDEVAYHRSIEIRWIRGTWANGPIAAWVRPRVPLIAGEAWTPLERVMVIADAESGLGPPVPPATHTFLNPDLTVYRTRPLEGDWVGVRVDSRAEPHGVGLSQSAIFDAQGECGRSLQSMVVAGRE